MRCVSSPQWGCTSRSYMSIFWLCLRGYRHTMPSPPVSACAISLTWCRRGSGGKNFRKWEPSCPTMSRTAGEWRRLRAKGEVVHGEWARELLEDKALAEVWGPSLFIVRIRVWTISQPIEGTNLNAVDHISCMSTSERASLTSYHKGVMVCFNNWLSVVSVTWFVLCIPRVGRLYMYG